MDTQAQQQDDTERDGSTDPATAGRWRWSRSARVGLPVAAVLVVLLLTSTFVAQPFLIPSSSMTPSLSVGDRILANKFAYRFGNSPGRGDVVVFDGTDSFVTEGSGGNAVTDLLRKAGAAVGLAKPSETDYVKRVIGVGGDRVRCCDKRGRIEVNGDPLDERYVRRGDKPSAVPFDIRVPRGRLWVMGDHRAVSSDSRDHLGDPGGGTVPVDRVIGRADWIVWPPRHFGHPPTPRANAHG
jgi:signal peptidase I